MNEPALFEHGHLNPGYLKLDLLCRGLRLDQEALGAEELTRRVRAGLGSGLEMRLPGPEALWVNAPVQEPFACESPYVLSIGAGGRALLRYGQREVGEVLVPAPPRFYAEHTSSGMRMERVGVVQGTYLGVYFGETCANWKAPLVDACRFCGLGSSREATGKRVQDVVETAQAARRELGITFVHVNGGFDDRERYVERFAPLVRRLHEETGLLLGLQIPPLPDPASYHRFRELGVNNLSLCFELWDPQRFALVCPGKCRRAGLDAFKSAIRYCAEEVRFDTTNGELIAGLEDPGRSMAAIDWLVGVGAVPTVCVFRPLAHTPLASATPPRTEDMVPVFAHLYRRCMERGLPIGIAPGVRVSIVMTPDEGRWLLPPAERRRHRWLRLRNAALRRVLDLRVRQRVRRARKRPRGDACPARP